MKNLKKLFEEGQKEFDEYGGEVIAIRHIVFDAAKQEFEAAQQMRAVDACPACRGEGFVGEHKQNRCKECGGTGKRR